MKFSLSFLKRYVDFDIDAEKVANLLILSGLEVEKIERKTPTFSQVIAAKIESVKKHPSSEKLFLVKVNDGTSTFQVICKDTNCQRGLIVPWAKVGAEIRDQNNNIWKVEKRTIQGIESFGTLCSAKSLQLFDEGEKILQLPSDIALGTDLATLLCDPILDITPTPNQGHCMYAIGIARELAALLGKKVQLPKVSLKETLPPLRKEQIEIRVEDKKNCPRYSCRIIENIKTNTTPLWIKKILEENDIRSTNGVVDILNFVMLEYGQPLHGFDYDKIDDQKINVISSKKEEKFLSLDSIERKIFENSLLITDNKKIIAVAGIIGSLNSAISKETKNILIESALFDPTSIRKTSKKMNLKTESSSHFEKGIDPNATVVALNRAAILIQQYCGGDIKSYIDIKEKEFIPLEIKCRLSQVNSILGTNLSLNEVESILQKLEFQTTPENEDRLKVRVPTYRNDICLEIDLIEEIARIYGYNNITKKAALCHPSTIEHSPLHVFEKKIREKLCAEGLQEFITCDLISYKDLDLTKELSLFKSSVIETVYSKSIEHRILRPSLLPSLLHSIKLNHDHKNIDIAAFEIGRIHIKEEKKFSEKWVLAIIMSGKADPYHWERKARDIDFFDLKGIIENLFTSLNISNYLFQASHHEMLHPKRQAAIAIQGRDIGSIGEVAFYPLTKLDIKKRIFFAEININTLFDLKKEEVKISKISPFPFSERDWTVTLKRDLPIQCIFDTIDSLDSKLLQKVELRDIYQDKKFKDVKKATFRFYYMDPTKTISSQEIEKEHSSILQDIQKKLSKISKNI